MPTRRTASRWALSLGTLVLSLLVVEALLRLLDIAPAGPVAGPQVGVQGFVQPEEDRHPVVEAGHPR